MQNILATIRFWMTQAIFNIHHTECNCFVLCLWMYPQTFPSSLIAILRVPLGSTNEELSSRFQEAPSILRSWHTTFSKNALFSIGFQSTFAHMVFPEAKI